MNELIQRAVEACPAGMILVDDNGVIELINEECERMFGHRRADLVGRSVDTVVPMAARAGHQARLKGYFADPSKRRMGLGRDLKALRADGTEFPVEIGLTPIVDQGRVHVLAFVVDITARRENEQAIVRYTAELEHANERLARFAYVASHDIQEPLRKIAVFADILAEGLAAGDREQTDYAAEVMRKSAVHARRLVADVLTLAQVGHDPRPLTATSLGEVVAGALDLLSERIAAMRAAVSCTVDDIVVACDADQAIRLVQNVVSNAVKYHRPGHTPTVEIRGRLAPSGGFVLSIADDGIGFPQDQAEAAFEPFRRLHASDTYQGTGMGLAICREIADHHGWTIRVDSAVDDGTTVTIAGPVEAAVEPW